MKKMTKKEVKQHHKPWITNGIRKAIQRREKLYKKFIKAKNQEIKKNYHKKYKDLRNQIVTLCRESKNLHYQNYFKDNANNTKKTWTGIKSIINIKSTEKVVPSSLLVNNKVISDPTEVANEFNNYFSTIASKLQSKIYHSGQDFNKYLLNRNEHSF